MKQKEKIKKTSNSWRFQGNELNYVKEVLDAGFASGTTGTMSKRFEEEFAKRFGMKYAVTSNSGTSTLHQALLAFGVGPGDEVIIPALTVVMCGYAVLHTGATPVFADVLPDTFLIDPKDIERKITKRTKAIMPVHLYGQVCDMDAIMRIAKKHNLYVLEDCAQCYLGTDRRGRIGGTIGHVGSFSLQSSKHITCGDGGVLITNDEMLAERMRKFGGLGFKHIRGDRNKIKKNKDLFQDPVYLRHDTIGFNYRLSEIGAAVALAQVEKIDVLIGKRKQMGKKYADAIRKTGCDWIIPQHTPKGYQNSYYIFSARFEGEKKLGISWYDFRKKYMEFGGDGIYAAWALVYNEPAIQLVSRDGRYNPTITKRQAFTPRDFLRRVHCPVAEEIQPKLLQFTTNQKDTKEMNRQASVLKKTIQFFNKS